MYQLAIFDLDGTIADTSPGILNSHRYAHKMMGRPVPTDTDLTGVIGGPLLKTYTDRFAFPPDEARKAVEIYRGYYSLFGIHEAVLYPGIHEMLEILHGHGIKIALATLKAEGFAKAMMKEFGIDPFFHMIFGMDEEDTRTKAALINMCIAGSGVSKSQAIMIGDTVHDRNGATCCGVDFLGVSYGFGFRPGDGVFPMAGTAGAVGEYILNRSC